MGSTLNINGDIFQIKAKEARLTAEAMCRDETTERELEMLSRLPDLCKIVRWYFVTEKKSVLPLSDVIRSVSDSYKSSIGHSKC